MILHRLSFRCGFGVFFDHFRRDAFNQRAGFLQVPFKLEMLHLFEYASAPCLIQRTGELFVFRLEFFVLRNGFGKGRFCIFEFCEHLDGIWNMAVKDDEDFLHTALVIEDIDSLKKLGEALLLLSQMCHLLEEPWKDMRAAGFAGALPAFKIRIFADHVFPIGVLPD